MSVLQLFTNNAVSLLNVPLANNGTSIALQPGLGSEFPQPVNPGEFFLVTLESISNPTTREIIKIIGRTGDTLEIDPAGRGQEGTVAQFWDANDTLVDHRVTAETMRQAFLQPAASSIPGPQGPAGPQGPQGVQGPQGIPGPAGSGSGSSISGSNGTAVSVEPAWTQNVSSAIPYADLKRGHKFWVTLVDSTNGNAETFEVLAVIQGLISSTNETVTWTQTNRIGYNFKGQMNLTLDTVAQTLSLSWQNTEPLATVTVTVAHLSL